MNKHTTVLCSTLLLSAALLPGTCFAVQGYISAYINATLVSSEALAPPLTGLTYGGCMANLTKPVGQAQGSPNCPGNWVALSCDGTYTTKEAAQRMFDQAQLASSTNKGVFLVVDDTKLHNGYCTVTRIDVYQ